MIRFDLTVSGNSVAQTTAGGWYLGSAFTTANSAPANADVHSRIGLNWTATAGQFSIRNLVASANSANYTGTQTITWVVNNTASTMTYRAPDGSNESVAAEKADLWIGTTREFNDINETTTAQTLPDFKFAFSQGTGTVDQDNFLIDPIPAIPTANAASSIGSNSFQANWSTVSGVTGYSIDVATDAAFTSFVSGYNDLYVSGAGTSSTVISGLSPGTPYWYRVRGTSQYSVGSFSSGNSGSQNPTTTSGTNTSVQFVSTSSSVAENSGTTNLALAITNFDVTNATSVTITATGATGRITTHTSPVVFPANSSSNENCVVTLNNNALCDGSGVVTLTITGISGGQGTPFIGTNSAHTLTVTDDDVCTSVQFVSATSSGTEGGGTVALTLAITNPSGSVATNVDVALTSGSAADVNSYTTQTATFPAGSSANQTVTITITDDALCEGAENLTFTAQNITGGQGTPFIGAQSTNVLTIADNDAFNAAVTDDFEDGNFLGWNEGTVGHWVSSTSSPLGGAYSLRHATLGIASTSYINKNIGAVDLTTSAATWQWQYKYNNDPSTNNKFWFWVSANEANVTSATVDGYAVGVNMTGGSDLITLWKVTNGISGTLTALVTSTHDWAANDVIGVRVTRSATGTWDLLLDVNGGFDALVSAGTANDVTYTSVGHVALHHIYTAGLTGLLRFDDFSFTSTRCENTYYSQSTGALTDAIWATTMVGSPAAVNFTNADNMVVQNTHVVTANTDVSTLDITVDAGGELVLAANVTASVHGDEVVVDGDLTANDGSELALVGSDATILESAGGPLSLYDMRVNTPAGTLTDATIGIRGTLLLVDGDFDCSTGAVSVTSTATGTGRLGPVGAGASYTGDLTVQRYIPAGATNWRLLGSAVASETVNEWKDDFITAGFPGSHYPNFDNPTGSGNIWPSIRWYDETELDASADTGLVGATGTAQSLAQGQGFAAWCGDNFVTTAAFTIDVTGGPHVANTPINLPLTYTNSGNPSADGFNLVSNPVASPIRFSSIYSGSTNIDDYITYFNPASGNSAVYDISSGLGLNGATDTIQSSQGFWLKANAAAPAIDVTEADKVVAPLYGGLFGGDQINVLEAINLQISSAINQFSDETVVLFNNGTPELDTDDVLKIVFANPDAPQIATVLGAGEWIAINAYGAVTEQISIPVTVDVGVSGNYVITASGMDQLSLTCVSLEDLSTGSFTTLNEGATYEFPILATDDAEVPRFLLHVTAPVALLTDEVTCNGVANGQATIVHSGTEPMDIIWRDAEGTTLLEQTITEGESVLPTLAAGGYTVSVDNGGGCGALTTEFMIEQPAAIEVLADLSPAMCADSEDGEAVVEALGGTQPMEYAWDNGQVGEVLTAGVGSYELTVTDANGCTYTETYVIEHNGPEANINMSTTTVEVNTPLTFGNASINADGYLWEFGDDNNTDEAEPTYTYTIPGTYTVTLFATGGDCVDTETIEITVETNTGISTNTDATALNAWFANDKFVVEHNFNNGEAVVIDVLDATGRLHATRKAAGVPARLTINADGLATGIWFVRVSNSDTQRTMRVPLLR
ncbi:MAG: hypothetical protein JNL43_16505 [Flavobacteriales bacterium]|nr:hypothetical protein [Flavobacteriales bacterium]